MLDESDEKHHTSIQKSECSLNISGLAETPKRKRSMSESDISDLKNPRKMFKTDHQR